ncbi:MAG: 30S ribosomal protein S20 [Thermodesulfobacteriota bacterium]
MALRKKSAIKKHRQSLKKRDRNRFIISTLRGKIKNFQNSLELNDLDKSKQILRDLISSIDRASAKGVLHKRAASRKISRYSKKISDLGRSLSQTA